MHLEFPVNVFENEKLYLIPNADSINLDFLSDKRMVVMLHTQQDLETAKSQILNIFVNACKIPADEIAILSAPVKWSSIAAFGNIKEVFLFGVNPREIGIAYNMFVYRFLSLSEKKILMADPIEYIMNNTQLKSDFWHKCLKPYFEK